MFTCGSQTHSIPAHGSTSIQLVLLWYCTRTGSALGSRLTEGRNDRHPSHWPCVTLVRLAQTMTIWIVVSHTHGDFQFWTITIQTMNGASTLLQTGAFTGAGKLFYRIPEAGVRLHAGVSLGPTSWSDDPIYIVWTNFCAESANARCQPRKGKIKSITKLVLRFSSHDVEYS